MPPEGNYLVATIGQFRIALGVQVPHESVLRLSRKVVYRHIPLDRIVSHQDCVQLPGFHWSIHVSEHRGGSCLVHEIYSCPMVLTDNLAGHCQDEEDTFLLEL